MATFSRFDTKRYYLPSLYILFKTYENLNVDWYYVNGTITEQDVKKINELKNYTVLVLKNTKNQDSEIIKKINSDKIKFSVVGGLNYFNKKKFNDSDYILRTIHSPNVLSKIIEIFESIEKNIKYSWTDRQKSMYVYKILTEKLHYKYDNESDYENHRDIVRSLEGLLYNRLVCAGFALVYKEAMDRIGIPCEYQNKKYNHSWNILELDGKKIGIDLTWDCYNKSKDNKCDFIYFGSDKNFYSNEHHDISNEFEEKKYNLTIIPDEDLIKDIQKITYNANVRSAQMEQAKDINNTNIYYIKLSNNFFVVYFNNIMNFISLSENLNIEEELSKKSITQLIFESQNNEKLKEKTSKITLYKRHDGTEFFILPTEFKKYGIKEYDYYDIKVNEDKKVIFRRGTLLSEMELNKPKNNYERHVIANVLLSHERLKRKILHYRGYVGYVDKSFNLIYDRNFEEQELGIKKRK